MSAPTMVAPWIACEAPERPFDGWTYLGMGCRGCVIALHAQAYREERGTSPRVAWLWRCGMARFVTTTAAALRLLELDGERFDAVSGGDYVRDVAMVAPDRQAFYLEVFEKERDNVRGSVVWAHGEVNAGLAAYVEAGGL